LNIEEYISSGMLEAYALGDLNAAERREVEKALAEHPALRAELTRIELTQESLLREASVTPKGLVKENLFAKIQSQQQAKVVTLAAAENVMVWKYSMAASVVFGLLAAGLAYNYYGKWRQSEENLTELLAQNQRMAQEYNTVNQRLDQLETDVRVINNPAFKRTVMSGTENAPQALASVYWNESTREVYLSIQNMKTLAQESQYQLWAIVDGKPVDMGVFDPAAGLLKMNNISGAVAFAVTIEPRGGKPSPSMETMQVIGKITS
jgi:anti-sigma-K factor RskA